MSVPTAAQQTVSSQLGLGSYPDPTQQDRRDQLLATREGQLLGANIISQASCHLYRQTVFDCNAANAAITLTGDMLLGGAISVTNAGVGAVVVNLPTAVALATALGAHWPISPAGATNPVATPLPNNNAPGSWRREIRCILENTSGQNLTITSSGTITRDRISARSEAFAASVAECLVCI